MSKKFKDTKLGAFLGNAAPHILDVAGDLLPDAGVLGMVKNLIERDEKIKPEDKKVALAKTKEMYELEVKDRDSARSREVEIKKTGNKDVMMTLTGIVGLVSFMFIIYAVVYEEGVMHNDLFVHLMGMVEGVVISNIFAYYYGTSADK
jgi:Fe2+ transport system protein B